MPPKRPPSPLTNRAAAPTSTMPAKEKQEAATKEPAKKKGRKKVTHEQARAACMRVMEEMFDLPAVLRGRKPVSQLAGLWPIAGWFCTVFVGMGMTVLNANTMRETQSTRYLRNFGSFARAIGPAGLVGVGRRGSSQRCQAKATAHCTGGSHRIVR